MPLVLRVNWKHLVAQVCVTKDRVVSARAGGRTAFQRAERDIRAEAGHDAT